MNLLFWLLTLLSLVGVVLNVKKNPACFYIWAVANAGWAVIDFYAGLPQQGVLFSVYFILAIYGIMEWRKATTDCTDDTEVQ